MVLHEMKCLWQECVNSEPCMYVLCVMPACITHSTMTNDDVVLSEEALVAALTNHCSQARFPLPTEQHPAPQVYFIDAGSHRDVVMWTCVM